MNMKTTVPISKARRDIFKIADDVEKTSRYYTLTDKGRPRVVMMSADEFESWQETLEVMKDFPTLKEDIKTAEREYRQGNYSTLNDLLVYTHKPKRHALSRRHSRTGSKRSQ